MDGESSQINELLLKPSEGKPITREEAHTLSRCSDKILPETLRVAASIRDREKGRRISYSRKIFIPLTNICRNRCNYCGFRKDPSDSQANLMTPQEVAQIAMMGEKAKCKEALFTLGESPEQAYAETRDRLMKLGYRSTIEYLHDACELVLEKTALLPHCNAGIMSRSELGELKAVSASMGLMLENASERLCKEGGPHEFSPGKHPRPRLAAIEDAGQLKIPFTTGLLIGIGETLEERVDSLFAIKQLSDKYGHIQEMIIQNFQPKHGTPMQNFPEPTITDILKTIAVARIVFRGKVNIQAPPNLTRKFYPTLLSAGINDWGGISPITKDFINPEASWPPIQEVKESTEMLGFEFKERLPIYPEYIVSKREFIPQLLTDRILDFVDAEGYVKGDVVG